MIARDKALYGGTSAWSAQEIPSAWDIAGKPHLL